MKPQFSQNVRNFFTKNAAFFLALAVIIAVLESANYSAYPRLWRSDGLVEVEFNVADVELKDFRLEDGLLISESNDPYITLSPGVRIGGISLVCSTTSPEILSQVYYRPQDEFFVEENSLKFRILQPVTFVQLPEVVDAAQIRLDLTYRVGDVLNCEKFTINPRPSYTALTLRLLFYFLLVVIWFTSQKFLPAPVKQKLSDGFHRYALLIFVALLILVDLQYTITLTWDSGHYLSLAEVIRQGTWQDWDPIRLAVFPLGIYLSQSVFGFNTTALLIPMMLAHILLFVVSYQLILAVFQPERRVVRLLIMVFVFLFVAMDPTVVGYYHTLLTEHPAATVAVLASLAAYQLLQAVPHSRRFYWLSALLILLVPFAWHIKQPYIGAALFPLLIASLLFLIRSFTKRNLLYVVIMGIVTAGLVLGSNAAWNGFLRSQGNPLNQNRRLSSFTEKRVEDRTSSFNSDPAGFIKLNIKRYLKSSNAVLLDKETRAMTDFSLTRGFQNEMIAHKMYIHTGALNQEPMPRFDPYVYYLQDYYRSPQWLDKLFKPRLPLSNFLFTVTLLLLPFYVIFQFVLWLKRKTQVNALLLILAGSAFLNALLHLLANQIDRYLFWGYPLSLLVITILLIQLVQRLASTRQRKTSASCSDS